jgi:putative membrane protein insertion efficiency factor
MTRFLLALIAFYRRWISPALHAVSTSRCKFIPTCSEYAAIAIATHGPLRGCGLAAWRLLRCHPFTPGGFDPVPPPAASRLAPPARSGGDCACTAPATPHEPLP